MKVKFKHLSLYSNFLELQADMFGIEVIPKHVSRDFPDHIQQYSLFQAITSNNTPVVALKLDKSKEYYLDHLYEGHFCMVGVMKDGSFEEFSIHEELNISTLIPETYLTDA